MASTVAFAVQTLVTLLGIVILAVLLLYAVRRLGLAKPEGPLSVVGRLPLEGRKSIYVVRVGDKGYSLLASESNLVKLDELDLSAWPTSAHAVTPLSQLVGGMLGRKLGGPHAS